MAHRLYERKIRKGAPARGLSCDEDGLFLGGDCALIIRASEGDDAAFQPRSSEELQHVFRAGYGDALDIGALTAALDRIALRMTAGEWGIAKVMAVQLRVPDLADDALFRVLEADYLTKFNPNHLPPGPNGGQFSHGPTGANGPAPRPVKTRSDKPEPNLGVAVKLPNGQRIRDSNSPTGFLLSPVADLGHVAEAGRKAGGAYRMSAMVNQGVAEGYLFEEIGRHVGTCGAFDYQRSCGLTGIEQHRQFRDVSNFNVGLYMQQTGVFTLNETLNIAGRFARIASSNSRPDKPHGLDPRTAAWIAEGYNSGASKVFGPASGG